MKNLKKLTLLHSNDMHGDFAAEQVDKALKIKMRKKPKCNTKESQRKRGKSKKRKKRNQLKETK